MEIYVRLANPPEELVAKYTVKEREFFFGYADHVLRLLKAQQVQQQLRHLMEIENMEFGKAVDLRIMAFPARPLHRRPRNILHGSYNHDNAQISMYPLKVKRDWIRREGFSTFKTPAGQLSASQRRMLREISVSTIATLIHEVLHVKFENRGLTRYAEEAIVRKLEKQYAHEWMSSLPVDIIEKPMLMSPAH